MHPELLNEIVALCKRRQDQGDHPTEPIADAEILENAIVQLSAAVNVRSTNGSDSSEVLCGTAPKRDAWRGGDSYEASMLRDLLAVIHRDGGHYVESHGLDKAIEDAHTKVLATRVALAELVRLKDIKECAEQCWPGDPQGPTLLREYSSGRDAAWRAAREATK